MKQLAVIACVLLSSCTMTHEDNINVLGTVTDRGGEHRLVLNYVEVQLPNPKPRNKGLDFHSLVWEVKDGTEWKSKIVVSQADFQQSADHRRWISRVHSLRADEGHAIFQVGEEGTPDVTGAVHMTYSWREWDLINNSEVRTIQICESPFEVYDESPKDDD